MKEPVLQLKKFKVTNMGDVTFTDAPSRQSIMEDMQRMKVLDKDTVIEEVTSPDQMIVNKPVKQPVGIKVNGSEPKYFTMPGGQKIKDDNGVLYSLEWRLTNITELAKRCNCVDLKIEHDGEIQILDWVELKAEGNNNASKTDTNV